MTNAIGLLLWLLVPALQAPGAAPAAQAPAQATSAPPSVSGPIPMGFQLGAGDVIEVTAWTGNENLRETLTVAADGTILVPFYVNQLVQVSGKTSIEIRTIVTDLMRISFRDPVVQVVQTKLESKKVLMGGEVGKPGAYAITGDTKVLDIIIGSGGFLSTANLAEVAIHRPLTKEQLTVNILEAMLGINPANNVKLEPQDIVYVPSLQSVSNKYFFISEGRSAVLLQTAEKVNLLEGLTRANVMTTGVRLNEVLVLRVSPKDGVTEQFNVKFEDLYRKADLSVNIPLETGDVVYLPKSGMARFSEVVAAINPILALIRDTVLFQQIFRNRNP